MGKHSTVNQSSPESTRIVKIPKVLKSFSHELGPKGGILPVQPRAHSYDNLKVSVKFYYLGLIFVSGKKSCIYQRKWEIKISIPFSKILDVLNSYYCLLF